MVGRKKSTTLLTPLELEIMQVLWETGPANVQTVQAGLKTESAARLHHRADHAQRPPSQGKGEAQAARPRL